LQSWRQSLYSPQYQADSGMHPCLCTSIWLELAGGGYGEVLADTVGTQFKTAWRLL